MRILLPACAYGAYVLFIYRIAWRILILLGPSIQCGRNCITNFQPTLSLAKSLGDILLLSRLFRATRRLWLGEWIFHLSFFLVILRHLRYVLNPVPEWISSLQPAGIFAGYVLPFSLLYILAMKIALEKEKYMPYLNFLLLGIFLFMSITGLLMRTIMRPDITEIKHFMIGLFSFAPGVPLCARSTTCRRAVPPSLYHGFYRIGMSADPYLYRAIFGIRRQGKGG